MCMHACLCVLSRTAGTGGDGSRMQGHEVFCLSVWIRLFCWRLGESLIVIKHVVTALPLRCGHS